MSSKDIAWLALAIAVLREKYTTPEGAIDFAELIPAGKVYLTERVPIAETVVALRDDMTCKQIGVLMGMDCRTVFRNAERAKKVQ